MSNSRVCRHTSPAARRSFWAQGERPHYAGDAARRRIGRPSTRGYDARATERQKSLASFLAPAYSSRQTRLRTTGSGMRARTRRSCTVIRREPIIFARDTFTFKSPFASAHLTFCTIASQRTRT